MPRAYWPRASPDRLPQTSLPAPSVDGALNQTLFTPLAAGIAAEREIPREGPRADVAVHVAVRAGMADGVCLTLLQLPEPGRLVGVLPAGRAARADRGAHLHASPGIDPLASNVRTLLVGAARPV